MSRPIEFDRQQVLQSAKLVFWQQGYGSTSITDLVKATGLQPGSLYAAFKNKKSLFLEVLETYSNEMITEMQALFARHDSAIGAIEAFYTNAAKEMANDESNKGCLIVNSMLELSRQDHEIKDRLNMKCDYIKDFVKNALIYAQQHKELSKDKDPEELASFLMSVLWGLKSYGPQLSLDELLAIVRNGLQILR